MCGHDVAGIHVERDVGARAGAADIDRIRSWIEFQCLISGTPTGRVACDHIRAGKALWIDVHVSDLGEQERVRILSNRHRDAGGHGIAARVDVEIVIPDTRHGDRIAVQTGYDDHTSRTRGRGKQTATFDVVSARIVARIDYDLRVVEPQRLADLIGVCVGANRGRRVLARYVAVRIYIEDDIGDRGGDLVGETGDYLGTSWSGVVRN